MPRSLRMARAWLDVTKKEMAKRLTEQTGKRVDSSLIGRYESGERSTNSYLLEALAAVCGVELSRVISWGED